MRRLVLLALLATRLTAAETTLTAGDLRLTVDDQARVTWCGAERNLSTAPTPLATVVSDGQPHAAVGLTVAGPLWQVKFADTPFTATLRVTAVGEQIEVALEAIGGQPEHLAFFDLSQLPGGAERGPLGVLHYDDVSIGLIAANPQTRIGDGVGRSGAALRAEVSREASLSGGRATLFVTPREAAPAAIAAAEARFGIPLGIVAKQGEANRGSYLMLSGVTGDNADLVVDWARRGNFGSVLLLHGTWADYAHGYAVPPATFPDGIAGLKRTVDQFHAAGVLVGAHCFASKIPKNADRMHPVPDPRLYQDYETTLAAAVDATATDLVAAGELTDWPRPTGTRDLLIGDEIVVYETCSDGPPWTFRNCTRGAYGTVAAAHEAGARIGHLATDEARNIWIIDPDTDLLDEHAAQLAATYNAAGFDWIYFDGAEDVPPPRWYHTSRPKLAVIEKLAKPPVTVESAASGAFCWHLDTRTGQRDYYWVSPSPKGEVDHAVQVAVPRARQQNMVPNLGWFPIVGSSGGRGGDGWTPLDDIEYVFGKAAATDSVVSVLSRVDSLRAHPHWDAALEIIGRYERRRLARELSEADRALLLRAHSDSMLVVDGAGEEHFVDAREMPFVVGRGRDARAMIAQPVAGVTTTSLFNLGRPVELEFSLDPRQVTFRDAHWQPLELESRPGARLVVPLRDRVLMQTEGIHRGEIQMALRGARSTPLPPVAVWRRSADAVTIPPNLQLVEPAETATGGLTFGRLLTPAGRVNSQQAPESFATYTFDLPEAGTWRVHPRIWSDDTNSNSFWLIPPDGQPRPLGNLIGDYRRWIWGPPVELELPAGEVTLKVAAREARVGVSPYLDALCLVTAASGYEPNDGDAREALGGE